MPTGVEGECTELLQALIRNACVNDGTVGSGQEQRSADLLATYLEGPGLDLEAYTAAPGRTSLVARIEGRDPEAPTLLLMGHTDVVPANSPRWRHDPFGGELVDGEVWGRGAIDMLNLTSSMAVAVRQLARSGFRPEGTLVYLAVADEEQDGAYGADHLVRHHLDAVRADYVITESGGIPLPSPTGTKLPVIVGEKGSLWGTIRIGGTPGHGSQPYRTDNALVTAAEVVRRLHEYRPETMIHDTWRRFISSMGYPEEITGPLLSEDGLDDMLTGLPTGMARQFHACTHTTFAPTVIEGGTKINVIPDTVDLQVDIRTLPGQTEDDARDQLFEALGDLAERVTYTPHKSDPSSASPVDTPLWHSLSELTQRWYPGSETVPFLTVGATDARFFRRMGSTAYGFGLFSEHLTFEDYGSMFHGDDERVDTESLRLSTELWKAVAEDLLG
ncbi:MAG: M20/M25/M40 family metallo-hydrolase [Acidimicrobiales bacterium]|jgi:acetylornithine deacetylase/succinyl-diaminopimelate desuccinylase-like protein|nr:M20/M25/M40 family metallo-hydrolase [Acidimicrobiales bacterium]